MKSITLLTASALLGAASAEVHKLKLNKVPLDEQLVRSPPPPPEPVPDIRKLTTASSQSAANIDRHVASLGQKYMGYRPSSSYQDTSIKPEGGHNVLVDNFLNAQCKPPVSTSTMNPLCSFTIINNQQ
jgi:saccharopepsin